MNRKPWEHGILTSDNLTALVAEADPGRVESTSDDDELDAEVSLEQERRDWLGTAVVAALGVVTLLLIVSVSVFAYRNLRPVAAATPAAPLTVSSDVPTTTAHPVATTGRRPPSTLGPYDEPPPIVPDDDDPLVGPEPARPEDVVPEADQDPF